MYESELEVALDAVRQAARYLLKEYAQFHPIADAPANISTEADQRSQEIILAHIRAHFPKDALCAEEPTESLRDASYTGPRLWIVDPIDGTRGFARKNGEFSVMVGFVDEGVIRVGVVAQPTEARITYAVKGQGCWRLDGAEPAPHKCRVTLVRELSQAALTQSRSRPGQPSPYVDALRPARVIESYSAGIKLALVARGEADVYLNTYNTFHDWDICAGQILVTEAGGIVTGTRGEELQYGLPGAWQRHGLLASNGKIHDEAIARLAKV